MKEINTKTYKIAFGQSGYSHLNSLIENNKYSKVSVLVDDNTEKFCLDVFKQIINKEISIIKINSGEEFKNLGTVTKIWNEMTTQNLDRKSLLINLGGGVITDMGGFAANTFKRGIDFINIPTTLLSMVDASVGSKTGINFNNLKNQIGTFADPKLVVIDEQYLETLSEREVKSGYAEIFKHSLISASIFNLLLENHQLYYNEEIINNSIQIKNKIVLDDKFEQNIRKNLNFGHTIGHALESYYLNKENKLTHGEAIAIGMICESFMSNKIFDLDLELVKKIKNHLLRIFPKVNLQHENYEEIINLMSFDKKNHLDKLKFVLLKDLGLVKIDTEVSENLIKESFDFYLS